jgi:hypothetical protein
MDGWVVFWMIVAAAVTMGCIALVAWYKAERLDAELTAYVAAGTMTTDTVKAILGTQATTTRKREIAALIADGMEPAKGLALLESMAAE